MERSLPPQSLLAEGAAMLQAVVADFAALSDCKAPECEVVVMRDARLRDSFAIPSAIVQEVHSREEELATFNRLAQSSDQVLLIAPEFSGNLHSRAQIVEQQAGKLISPSAKFVALAADKWCSHLLLAKAGVPTPHSLLLQRGVSLPSFLVYPVVLKPVDGCGSIGVQRVNSAQEKIDWSELRGPEIIAQAFHSGMAASIAVLCGPTEKVCLPACRQMLSNDGRFRYLGGETPLPAELQERAEALALDCLAALPPACGWVGIDLMLGESAEYDCVIEINPRVTTSYVGLRALCQTNLAAAMLAVVAGKKPALQFHSKTVRFAADGKIEA